MDSGLLVDCCSAAQPGACCSHRCLTYLLVLCCVQASNYDEKFRRAAHGQLYENMQASMVFDKEDHTLHKLSCVGCLLPSAGICRL